MVGERDSTPCLRRCTSRPSRPLQVDLHSSAIMIGGREQHAYQPLWMARGSPTGLDMGARVASLRSCPPGHSQLGERAWSRVARKPRRLAAAPSGRRRQISRPSSVQPRTVVDILAEDDAMVFACGERRAVGAGVGVRAVRLIADTAATERRPPSDSAHEHQGREMRVTPPRCRPRARAGVAAQRRLQNAGLASAEKRPRWDSYCGQLPVADPVQRSEPHVRPLLGAVVANPRVRGPVPRPRLG